MLASVPFSAAAVVLSRPSRTNWLQRLLGVRQRHSIAEPPAPSVKTESGWTTITCDDFNTFAEWLGKDEEGFPAEPGEIPSLGSHLLIELYGCKSQALRREEEVESAMLLAARESRATVVERSFHEFKPYGVSGAVIIQESHYTIHTWPEHRYAAVDLFYCGGTVLVHRAVEVLQREFQPQRIRFMVIRRGLQSEVEH